jgi:cation transport regulator ChaC
MSEEQVEDSGPTEGTEDMVQIEEAADEDLDAFLDDDQAGLSDDDSEDQSLEAQPEQQKEEQKEPGTQEEPKPQMTQEQLQAFMRQMQEEVQKAQRQVQGQELLVQRRVSEIGQMKQYLAQLNQQLLEGLGEKQLEDPKAAAIDQMQILKNQQQIEQLDQQAHQLSHRGGVVQQIQQHIPKEEWYLDDMCQALKDDGIPEEDVARFRADPTGINPNPGGFIVQLQRRARAERYLGRIVPAFQALKAENEKLKAQIAKGPRAALQKVERAARQTPSVASSTPTSNGRGSLDMTDPTKLTDEELNDYLRSQGYEI